MASSVASLYLDEDVSVLVAVLLRSRGFPALTVRDAGRRGRSDAEQLAFAAESGMVMLTHNRADFAALHVQYLTASKSHSGILIATRRPPNALLVSVQRLLNSLTADDLHNQLLYV